MAEATAREQQLWTALHRAFKRAGMAAKVKLTRETPYGFEFAHDGHILLIDQATPVRVKVRLQRLTRSPDRDRSTAWEIHVLEREDPPYRLNSQQLAEDDVARIVLTLLRE